MSTFLNPYMVQFLTMSIAKLRKDRMNYTFDQKWVAANIHLSSTASGYEALREMLSLPSNTTVTRTLGKFKTPPGSIEFNVQQQMKTKLNLKEEKHKICFVMMNEMSLRRGLCYDQQTDKIFGYEDLGKKERTQKKASQALCVMVRGIVKKWKFPISYLLFF